MKTIALLTLSVFLLPLSVSAQSDDRSQQEQHLVKQLNQSRREAGLPALTVDRRLTEAARQHSQLMADQNKLGHVLPGEEPVARRLAATGLRFNRSGENIGYNTDFDRIHEGFMNSPPHRENILSPDYTEVGIGLVRDDNGVYWATQDFAHGLVHRTADQAEDLAAQSFARLRSASGAPAMKRQKSKKLHDLACSMGNRGKLDPRQVLAVPGVHYVITYNNSRPEELPSSARSIARERALTEYAVGACFIQEKSNPGGTYYVVMAFY